MSTFSSSYLEELFELSQNGLFSMNKIEWWLLKYSEVFLELEKSEQSLYFNWLAGVKTSPSLRKEKLLFIDTYRALETISKFHRNEDYLKDEVRSYNSLRHPEKVKEWLEKNETIGSEIYACFLLDYLDYSNDAKHLNVFVKDLGERSIFVDRKDFENTLLFLDIFNNLYWKN